MEDFEKSIKVNLLKQQLGVETGIEKSFEDEIEKGGEGSRGGRIIGHTKSGKPIYANAHPDQYDDFNDEDHADAAEAHGKMTKRAAALGFLELRDHHKLKMNAHRHIFAGAEKAFEDEFNKARSGVYKNTPDNRKQGRAGERYGAAVHGGQTQDLEGDKKLINNTRFAPGEKETDVARYVEKFKKYVNHYKTIIGEIDWKHIKEDIRSDYNYSKDPTRALLVFNAVKKELLNSSDTLQKAVEEDLISEEVLEKARAGIYAPTAQNKKKGVVGQKYGSKKPDEAPAGEKPKQEEGLVNLEEHAKTASEAALNAAIKQSPDPEVRQAAHNELKRRQTEEKSGGEVFGKPAEDKGTQLKKEYHEGMKKEAKETKQLREDKGIGDKEKEDKVKKSIDNIRRYTEADYHILQSLYDFTLNRQYSPSHPDKGTIDPRIIDAMKDQLNQIAKQKKKLKKSIQGIRYF